MRRCRFLAQVVLLLRGLCEIEHLAGVPALSDIGSGRDAASANDVARNREGSRGRSGAGASAPRGKYAVKKWGGRGNYLSPKKQPRFRLAEGIERSG